MSRDDDGYTLMEMLVVVGVIALLVAVLTPALMGQMARAKAKAAHLQMQTLSSAIEAYRADVGRPPSVEQGLKALVVAPERADGWLGPYLRDEAALKDPWGRPVAYGLFDDTVELTSLGADGKPGGKSVNADIVVH
jgi:general secretion pathway protein G